MRININENKNTNTARVCLLIKRSQNDSLQMHTIEYHNKFMRKKGEVSF